jgi:1-acyl-sn-glycerol-3-phosphate acyltransferase
MIQPSENQLLLLSPTERVQYWFADFFARHLKPIGMLWNRTFMYALLWVGCCRRFHVHGVDHIQNMTRQTSVLMVCNHRTFFDFFAICYAIFSRGRGWWRVFFPVRTRFFYDRPLGGVVNLAMGCMAMFPPIMRKRDQIAFNDYSIQRMAAELAIPSTLIGIHPEGTRNKTDDPYTFLTLRPGAGRVALAAETAIIQPIFVLGLSSSMRTDIYRNWFSPRDWPVHVWFGEPVDLADLREKGDSPQIQMAATRRIMDRVHELALMHKSMVSEGSLASPAPSQTRQQNQPGSLST